MDHVVFLGRHHPGLRQHHAVAVGERAVEGVRVAPRLKLAFGKPRRRRQRPRLLERAVAVGADAAVDLFAPLERRLRQLLIIPVGQKAGVVDLLFIGRRLLLHEQQRIRRQLGRPGRTSRGDRRQIRNEIEKLLPVGQQVGQARRHQRHRRRHPLVDLHHGQRDFPPAAGGVAERDRVGRLAGNKSRDALPLVGKDCHAPIGRSDHRRRIEHRLDQIRDERVRGDALRHRCQIRPKHPRPVAHPMTLRAGHLPAMEHVRPAERVTLPPHRLGQRNAILGREGVGEQRRGDRRG